MAAKRRRKRKTSTPKAKQARRAPRKRRKRRAAAAAAPVKRRRRARRVGARKRVGTRKRSRARRVFAKARRRSPKRRRNGSAMGSSLKQGAIAGGSAFAAFATSVWIAPKVLPISVTGSPFMYGALQILSGLASVAMLYKKSPAAALGGGGTLVGMGGFQIISELLARQSAPPPQPVTAKSFAEANVPDAAQLADLQRVILEDPMARVSMGRLNMGAVEAQYADYASMADLVGVPN